MAGKNDSLIMLPFENELQKAFAKLAKIQTDKIEESFGQIGEDVTNDARTNKSYTDDTANLKNSTGYVVKVGAKTSQKQFGEDKKGREGALVGLKLAEENSTAKKGETELIITAGMNYAIHVENKGKTVLTAFLPTAIKTAKKIENYFK